MRVFAWRAKEVFGEITQGAIERAGGVMDLVVAVAKRECPVGSVIREGKEKKASISFTPGSGPHKGKMVSFEAKQWTGRYPGTLRNTIRKVERPSRPGNIRVYAGNKKVYYAHFVEYGTKKWSGGHPFLRRALENIRREAVQKIANDLVRK